MSAQIFPSTRQSSITRRIQSALRKARDSGTADPVKEAARRLKISASLRARYAADVALREAKAVHLEAVRPPVAALNEARGGAN